MLEGMRANNVSLTRPSTSPGEEESKAWATACSMPQVVDITKAAGTPLPVRPHHESHSTLREEVEVVEVSSHLPSWLVVGGDLPTLQLWAPPWGGRLAGCFGLP